MTAGQLAHLAEQAGCAADFVAATNPSMARRFAAAAEAATRLSADLGRQEQAVRLRVDLAEIKAGLVIGAEVA
jgi:hypothetical protein